MFVDLLTYQDLEVLKIRKLQEQGAGPQQPPARPALPPSNKRYLILTYAAEFDRVHYPLPLLFDENPDPEHLRQVCGGMSTCGVWERNEVWWGMCTRVGEDVRCVEACAHVCARGHEHKRAGWMDGWVEGGEWGAGISAHPPGSCR